MGHAHHPKQVTEQDVTLKPDTLLAKLPLIGAVMAVIGLGATFALGAGDPSAMYSSYLVAFLYFLAIAVGGYFFVTIFFLGRSAWNVTVRRIAENAMSTLPVFIALFIPIYLGRKHIYHWMDERLLETDALLQWKQGYLNDGFFTVRSLLYFVVWTVFAVLFYRASVGQDRSGDKQVTARLQGLAAPAIALGGLATSFAAMDWGMSLDFHWFSTIYGIYYFAAAMVSCMAVVVLFALALRKHVNGLINEEHLHGVAMLMFGFNIFWSYIAFSQFFLIWYANIPEETLWYMHRWEDGWSSISMLLLVGHFILPFFFLLPRQQKRNPVTLTIGATWLLVMHFVDMYWLVKPSVQHAHGVHGVHFGLTDITAMLGVGGVFLAVMGYQFTRNALVAYRDPRLPEALKYDNI